MFRQIKSSLLFGIAVCVLIGDNSPAAAAPVREVPQGERYIKNTEDTAPAFCLKKYLYDYNVVESTRHGPESDKFSTCYWESLGGSYSVITCIGGAVENDETAEVKFYVRALPETAEVLCAKWYNASIETPEDPCSQFMGYAEPVASLKARVTAFRADDEFKVTMVLRNEAKQWESGAPAGYSGTIYGSEIYYAEFQGELNERHMNEYLWTCHDISTNTPQPGMDSCEISADCGEGFTCGPGPGITWVHPPEWDPTFELEPGTDTGEEFEFPGTHKGSKRLLFRFYTDHAHVYGTSDYEVVQFRVRDEIPTVSEWGMVVIALLLAAGGTIVLMRRRAMAG